MDFQQLFHLVCAAEHYSFHQQEALESGSSVTILDFFIQHYLDPANDPYESKTGHEEHPCSHSHNHTIDFAELDFSFPEILVKTNISVRQIIATIPVLHPGDFTSGLDEPPSLA